VYTRIFSAAVIGVEGFCVEVEVDISRGLPSFEVSGLAASSVREARDRVRAAIRNSGFDFPLQRITINLAPADVRKAGSMLDCAMALGILIATKQIVPRVDLNSLMVLGELSLEGQLRPIHGILPMVLAAKKTGFQQVMIPASCKEEAERGKLPILRVETLKECVHFLTDPLSWIPVERDIKESCQKANVRNEEEFCFRDVKGNSHAKKALEVAAAGNHHVIMVGPPGTGKTMMAQRVQTILPPLNEEQALEVDCIYSSSGILREREGYEHIPPFRSPHPSISIVGLTGGGAIPHPGELSLAHQGILFLDELPEFSRSVLEILRQPIEDGKIIVIRNGMRVVFPGRFLLIASLNPCPCGFNGFETSTHFCTCNPYEVKRYRKKLSGPFLDRIDVQIEVPRVDVRDMDYETGPASKEMKKRVEKAREIQKERYKGKSFRFNSDLSGRWIKHYIPLSRSAEKWLHSLYDSLKMSNRSFDKIIKMARTIADLAGEENVREEHLSEAVQYRALDYRFWSE